MGHPDRRRLAFIFTVRKEDFDVFGEEITSPQSTGKRRSSMTAWIEVRPFGANWMACLIFQASDAEGVVHPLDMIDPRSPATKARLTSSAVELNATISPDGRWLAFVMAQDGHSSVYVQRFPGAGPAVKPSLSWADNPYFRPQGRELYLRRGPEANRHVVGGEG